MSRPTPKTKTRSGQPDYHEDCPCRAKLAEGGSLCPKCYGYGLKILMYQGFGKHWKRFRDIERTWEKVQAGYLRISRRVNND